MSVEIERLLDLIDFARQSAQLRSRTASSIADHKSFALYEHELLGLPGVRLDTSDGDEESWLAIERLSESAPPPASESLLQLWLEGANDPRKTPQLKASVSGRDLIAAGTHRSVSDNTRPALVPVDPVERVALDSYIYAPRVRSELDRYVTGTWRRWAERETPRRTAIALYRRLFALKQQVDGALDDAQIEVVWGLGMAVQARGGRSVLYPLISRLVEISLDPGTAELSVRPRDVEPRLEVDWCATDNNPGLVRLEEFARAHFDGLESTLSPFDPPTYVPVLKFACSALDGAGIWWPDQEVGGDRKPPQADARLKVTDTWVLFARPRTNNLYLQDLEKLKSVIAAAASLPPAVNAVVTEPGEVAGSTELPNFRGVSVSSGAPGDGGTVANRDLYFPKPYNDEQVRIVQLLDVSDGVVVQGPPGTGKTHTIANVICHYLAEGKRVLVTSMKDPALAVLREQLPEEIRPLAISLLSSEADGMKQFEHSIQKIAAEVQQFDPASAAQRIKALEQRIDALHAEIALTDRKISEWANRCLSDVVIDDDTAKPEIAAREVVASLDQLHLIPDELGIGGEYAPRFGDPDVVALRDVRGRLGSDLVNIDAQLPVLGDLPDAGALLKVHQDLSRIAVLQARIDAGEIPALCSDGRATVEEIESTIERCGVIRTLRQGVAPVGGFDPVSLREYLLNRPDASVLEVLAELGSDLDRLVVERRAFVARPVSVPAGVELRPEFIPAVRNLSQGKSPFGLSGVFGRREERMLLDDIRIVGAAPADADGWGHVLAYLELQQSLFEVAIRWNALTTELPLPLVDGKTPAGGLMALQHYGTYSRVADLVDQERATHTAAAWLLPEWRDASRFLSEDGLVDELERILRHHAAKARMADVWAAREAAQAVLHARRGPIVDAMRQFFADSVGNTSITDAQFQDLWAALTRELVRVHFLAADLEIARNVLDRIAASGAPRLAALLRLPLDGPVDESLPGNWRTLWRARRLKTHLELVSTIQDLHDLAAARRRAESDLAAAYRRIVEHRTWLKLHENASPGVRSALQAYMNAIRLIGKGTGIRAVRYRRDARAAAAKAHPAVPCWIMAHYRVSESLPAELGCFDLVVIDEASQSDLSALPALLRAKKVLIVGDDKQVSPEGVGLDEESVLALMSRHLGDQVATYRPQMSPERSLYDLFKVVFAASSVMLREHFRCVGPIIEYSKREFYNHELQPLRLPKSSERIDPPLVDVLVENGFRHADANPAEVRFIADEIARIVRTPGMEHRSIGVVSLIGNTQAKKIWNALVETIGLELIQRHQIACGDAWTFQGKERDIMFLSMVVARGERITAITRGTFAQRFNVAASRARDRMYLVRSVDRADLSDADTLRHGLLEHFRAPFAQDDGQLVLMRTRCESDFEREMYDDLTERGYRVVTQVKVGAYRIDMVVEGENDTRLAVECDGDRYHGPEQWVQDMKRQRVLERVGWTFWRCLASAYCLRKAETLEELIAVLTERGIAPIGADGISQSIHVETRRVRVDLESRPEPEEGPLDETAPDPDERVDGPGRNGQPDVVAPAPVAPPRATAPTPGRTPAVPARAAAPVVAPTPVAPARALGALLGMRGTRTDAVADARAAEARRSVFRNVPASEVFRMSRHSEYVVYSGRPCATLSHATDAQVAEGLMRIIESEGPMVARRAYVIYMRSYRALWLDTSSRHRFNKVLAAAQREGLVAVEDESGGGGLLYSTVRLAGAPAIRLRKKGPRTLEEIPSSELKAAARIFAAKTGNDLESGNTIEHIRQTYALGALDQEDVRLIRKALERSCPVVGPFLAALGF